MSIARPGEDGTVSLAHRQLDELRTRNRRFEARLRELTEAARANERRFAACRDVALALLRCRCLEDVVRVAVERLPRTLGIDRAALLGPYPELGMRPTDPLSHLLPARGAFLGNIRPAEAEQLFADDEIRSVAIAPLGTAMQGGGFLALGSREPTRFAAGDGTVFVEFVADTTAAAIDLHRGREAPCS